MPLLRKKAFETSSMPEFLRDDEEVFLCEVTNEIFRDYEEFCQRIILVNSMVWSCSMTGKSNLTYAEALNSEQAARKSIQDFPYELRTPVLYLASKTKRSGFGEMAEDVFSFVKDHYFVGEIVESSFTENNWRESHVLQVIAPTEEQILAYAKIEGSDETSLTEPLNSAPSSLYRYEIEQLDADDQDSSQVMIIEACHIRRKKGPFTKEKTRLFLKQFMEQKEHGVLTIKESARRQFNIDNVRFDQIFDGPLPDFEISKRIAKATVTNGKKVRQETLAKYLKKQNYFGDANGQKLLADMKRREEVYKQKCAEMKQKKVEEKTLEKQKRKEENMKMSSYVKEWYKPKDDLELEDQKKLASSTLVQTKIPQKYFGDALMVLEFADQFSTLINTKDFFPGGLTLDLMERALTEKEVAGPLTDIIQLFLTAIFNVQEEEALESKNSQADLNSEDMTETMTLSEASHLATLASNWSVAFQGMALSRLPLYPLTVSEILRLHLLSSGARLSESATKWRYQQRGGYTSEDDPGLTLRVKYPHILKALAIHNVNQLPMVDKLRILSCLVNQLLTYADIRDAIEEKIEKHRQLKLDLRSLQITERKREQEFMSVKLKMKRESKGVADTDKKELDKLQKEADKKKAEFESKNKELIKASSENQIVLGMDRAFRRYIKSTSIPAIFIENNEKEPGVCLSKIIEQKPELIDADHSVILAHVRKRLEENFCNGSDKENEDEPVKVNGIQTPVKQENDIEATKELLMCTANNLTCPVHSNIGKPEWTFLYSQEEINQLSLNLNKRGIRENELRQVLEYDKEPLEEFISTINPTKLNASIEVKLEDNVKEKPVPKKVQNMYSRYEESNLGYTTEMELSEVLHLTLVDNILEMEEKIALGCLGQLKIKDRKQWRDHLQNRKYDLLDKTLVKREVKSKTEGDQIDKLKSEEKNSRPGTPDSVYRDPGKYLGPSMEPESDSDNDSVVLTVSDGQQTAVKALAIALTQVSQAVELKHLRKPLGHCDASAKNKKEEADVLERWEQSLLASTSYSQIFLHYGTLDNCIMWGRSVLLAKCKICHRRKDPENMLLCDTCNKGHHMYCLKPKLTSVPKGNWFCNKCKPKEKPATPRASKRTRKLFTEESDNEEEVKNGHAEKEKSTNISIVEVCEECGSGGHVICCDFCPKVYHLECTQPPMRRIPRGEWKCHKCKRKSTNTNNHQKEKESSVDHPLNNTGSKCVMGEVAQHGGTIFNRRSCAAKARHKIHGFVQSLRRKSVDSGSNDDVPQRRSYRRGQESKNGEDSVDDDLPLHNAPLQELLSDVMRHKDSWPFVRPVTKTEVPDYYEVITKPMDFGKIKYKLNMGEYTCDADVMADCALVFDNCNTYNTSDAPVYKCGYRLMKFVIKRCSELSLDFPDNLMDEIDDEEEEGPTKPKRARH